MHSAEYTVPSRRRVKTDTMAYEVNFDGLIGPTHHFAGLAFGNIASMTHKGQVSNPKKAALQGLLKMKILSDAGLKQAVIPPVARPDFAVLRNLGFTGTREQVLRQLSSQPADLISAFFSASSMWTANSATVSPSQDTGDGKVHLTPANLTSKLHRALEPAGTKAILKAIFPSEKYFQIHDPLFPNAGFGDEGAANATRFCEAYGNPGIEFFVYGRRIYGGEPSAPHRFPARQTLEASQAVARLHSLSPDRVVFGQQNPIAIDAGAFHNDVVSVGNRNLLFYHQEAFSREEALFNELKAKFSQVSQQPLLTLCVKSEEVPLKEVVKSYLFNSQILSLPNGENLLLAPTESEESHLVRAYLNSVVGKADSPLHQVKFIDLRESMHNGGGPACLRLRVVLNETELQAVSPGVFLNETLYSSLVKWVEKYYRDRLSHPDLCDPRFVLEVESALDELTQILKLGSIYPFQKTEAKITSC